MTRRGSTVRFAFVDVFASVPLTGNPVSIVPDADDLTEAQMQAIAGVQPVGDRVRAAAGPA
jgi:predicted PhzF superfamily epimerase YddE/YHI9